MVSAIPLLYLPSYNSLTRWEGSTNYPEGQCTLDPSTNRLADRKLQSILIESERLSVYDALGGYLGGDSSSEY
jgi:hypothetical protein